MIWKKSLLLTCKILRLLVHTFAADEKCPILNRHKLRIHIQIQLSEKEKTFPEFSAAFLESRLNLKIFELKNDPHGFCTFEVTDSENVVR